MIENESNNIYFSIYIIMIGAIEESSDFTVVKSGLYGKLLKSFPDTDHTYICFKIEFIQKGVDY